MFKDNNRYTPVTIDAHYDVPNTRPGALYAWNGWDYIHVDELRGYIAFLADGTSRRIADTEFAKRRY